MLILFDFDGTIADTFELAIGVMNNIAPKYRLPILTPENRDEFRNKGLHGLVREYKIDWWKLIRLVATAKRQMREVIHQATPFEEALEHLKSLSDSGIKLGIMTSNSAENIDAFLSRHGLGKLFSIKTTDVGLFSKGRAIRSLCKKHHLAPGELILVGDEVRDVLAARQAGVPSLAVTWGFQSAEALAAANPTWIAKSWAELRSVSSGYNETLTTARRSITVPTPSAGE